MHLQMPLAPHGGAPRCQFLHYFNAPPEIQTNTNTNTVLPLAPQGSATMSTFAPTQMAAQL